MRRGLASVLFLLLIAVAVDAQCDASEVKCFREKREKSFRDAGQSPLRRDLFAGFTGLKYFDADPRFAVSAKFEKTDGTQIFLIPTNIGTTRRYLKVGVLSFEISGTKLTLSAFRLESAKTKGKLFVPFRDSTSGTETYSAGRYLEIGEPSENGATVVDFNLAYNPSCAYGDESYSCTLPPKENFLGVAIKAGEKAYLPATVTH